MKRQSETNQLLIDWAAAVPPPEAAASPAPPERLPVANPGPPALVQILPWDFQSRFPLPLQDALEAGVITEEDFEPENLAMLHMEHGKALLAALVELDHMHHARRSGTDPATGKMPRNVKKKAALTSHPGEGS